MRLFIAFTSAVLLGVGCYHGPSLQKFGPAQDPEGIGVDLRLRHAHVLGELLEVQDSSLLVLTDVNQVVSVPVASIRHGLFHDLGELLGPGLDRTAALSRLRNLSRFPAGLTPALRSRLLAAYDQTEVLVVQ
jgi:hypothetical protein